MQVMQEYVGTLPLTQAQKGAYAQQVIQLLCSAHPENNICADFQALAQAQAKMTPQQMQALQSEMFLKKIASEPPPGVIMNQFATGSFLLSLFFVFGIGILTVLSKIMKRAPAPAPRPIVKSKSRTRRSKTRTKREEQEEEKSEGAEGRPKSVAKTTAKAPTKSTAVSPAKASTKSSAKSSAKSTAKTPAKSPAKSSAEPPAKTPAKSPAKSPAGNNKTIKT